MFIGGFKALLLLTLPSPHSLQGWEGETGYKQLSEHLCRWFAIKVNGYNLPTAIMNAKDWLLVIFIVVVCVINFNLDLESYIYGI